MQSIKMIPGSYQFSSQCHPFILASSESMLGLFDNRRELNQISWQSDQIFHEVCKNLPHPLDQKHVMWFD